jgi:5-(aminomethyl)-3-furanmethanol phosphate kinase
MRGGHAQSGLTVVKLGGSLAFSALLAPVLAAIEEAPCPVVVVPGGGPFADAVRAAQPRMGYADEAAHKMALMAMAQFAEALAGKSPRLLPASNLAAIRTALAAGAIPIWSPWPLTDGLETLPASWDLTSDSLSAWLAGKLGAERLVMIKHGPAPATLAQAAKSGRVDPLFPHYARLSGSAIVWADPSQPGAFADRLVAACRECLPA